MRRIAPLFLAAAPFVFFWKNIFGGETFYTGDTFYYFFPQKHFLASSLRDLHIPFWQPSVLMGTPFASDPQSAVFYPPSFLFLLSLPLSYTYSLFVIFHVLLAALSMYGFGRKIGLPPLASSFSALLFVFGGTFLSLVNRCDKMAALSYLPLLLFCFSQAMEKKKWWALISAMVLSFQILTGGLEMVGMTVVLLLLFALRGVPAKKRELWWRLDVRLSTLAILFSVLLLALCFTLFQTVPFGDLLMRSSREGGLSQRVATDLSLYPEDLLSHGVSGIFFNRDLHTFQKGPLGTPERKYLISHYIGLLGVCFAAIGFTRALKRGSGMMIFPGIYAIFLILSLGEKTPVYPFLFRLFPPLSFLRYPEKYYAISFFALAIMAGLGLNKWVSLFEEFRNRKEEAAKKKIPLFPKFLFFTGLFLSFLSAVSLFFPGKVLFWGLNLFGRPGLTLEAIEAWQGYLLQVASGLFTS